MDKLSNFSREKVKHLLNSSCSKLASFLKSSYSLIYSNFCILISRLSPFWAHLNYFIFFSLLGFLVLKVSKPNIRDLDLFFTSVSALTVSSMSTVEMEVFSNTQLLIITVLMLVGGEIFISLLGLQFMRSRFKKIEYRIENRVDSVSFDPKSLNSGDLLSQIELGLVNHHGLDDQKPNPSLELEIKSLGNKLLKYESVKCLGYLVLCYLLVVHVFGSTLISIYISHVPSAREVLKNKGLHVPTFSAFLTVSTFANCGFTPTNENMVIFNKNSGLLLILIPQLLLGNTLFAPCLYFFIWVLEKLTKREEFSYLLRSNKQVGYAHLVSKLNCMSIAGTAFGFILLQFILFCSLEWNSEVMGVGVLDSYEKLVGSLFQVVNSRHAGESVFDLSIVSPANLVLFVMMMYLPSYTSFFPYQDFEPTNERKSKKERKNFVNYILFSQVSYLVIFIILICITEREKMKDDPLNFNVLNITLEVVSAYGNVGFSTGYSCKRRLKKESYCKDASYGFVGRWSESGKVILIMVMLFGRLKHFTKGGGKAWKLS